MKIVSEIFHADCLEKMKEFPSNYFSAIITDPPYGLKFMGKEWDYGIPGYPYWKHALRICKPGSFLLAFGGTRTFHRLTCAIEEAGWEIRDCLMWLYGTGFPKSHNNFGLEGYGTALKPAWEPIIMAMKPCEGTFKQNAEKWGQAGINIDECRIGTTRNVPASHSKCKHGISMVGLGNGSKNELNPNIGRWPANLILDEEACDVFGGASRFFYCAKASSDERNKENNHPTVKPIKLMEYLIKLVMPPSPSVLLDPFTGSGTTLLAAKNLGFEAIGIEINSEYVQIARKRLE